LVALADELIELHLAKQILAFGDGRLKLIPPTPTLTAAIEGLPKRLKNSNGIPIFGIDRNNKTVFYCASNGLLLRKRKG